MAGSNHGNLEQLFSAALEKGTSAERDAFLDGACGTDTALRSHVQELLKVHDKVGSFMDSPPVDTDATVEAASPHVTAGRMIGRYKILQEIGEGGFGIVYMAEQEVPVRRIVALKIIKLGMDTKQVIARFEAERQALALMDHPNIAQVLDAGATETGRPYFVMELVKGVSITRYCNENKLTMTERLQLMLPVCHAIQHAHQKGIIHRDLKPSNVLVMLHDGEPSPKVIDFGIAKATTQRLTEKTLFTGFRDFVGTPEYMSPDQAGAGGLDVDTRTDVYSLGVMLYELLTGSTPFEKDAMRNVSFDEIRRIVREVEPPIPSTRLHTLSGTEEGIELGKLRRSAPTALPKILRGDLDWIVMKAMEKDRTRRYATVKDLADDIERHLRDEPVLAGPPRLSYKFRKFVRRHRMGVIAGFIVGVAVLTGISLAMIGLVQANRSRDEARQERVIAQQQRTLAEANAVQASRLATRSAILSQFLQDMLRSVDPSKALGREMTVRYLLDEAARNMDNGTLEEQPEVEASVRLTFGETYGALGRYQASEHHLREAQTIFTRIYGDDHPDTLRASRALAGVLRLIGEFSEAETLLRRTIDAQRRVLGNEHTETLASMNELALALWGPGRFAEAESIHRQTLDIQRRVLGHSHPDTLESLGHVGMVCRALGRQQEAESLLRQALSGCRESLGDEHPLTSSAMSNLGLLLEDQRNFEQAQTLFEQSYEQDYRVLGPDHPRTLVAMNNLVRIYEAQGKTEESRPVQIRRLEHLRRAAEQDSDNALTVHAYAWELVNCEFEDLRDAEAGLPFAVRAAELDDNNDAGILETLAITYRMTGQLDQAIATQRRAVALAGVDDSSNQAELKAKLVEYLLEKGDVVGAAATVSWDRLASQLGETLLPGSVPGEDLIEQSESLMRSGRYLEAAEVLRGCLAVRQKELPEGHWLIAETRSLIGQALCFAGKYEEAESLLLEGYYVLKTNRGASSDNRRAAIGRLVELYDRWRKPEKLLEWRGRLGSASSSAVP